MEKQIVCRGIIRLDKSNGTYTELEFVVPNQVASDILIRIMNWEEDYCSTVKEVSEYLVAQKEFLEKEKTK